MPNILRQPMRLLLLAGFMHVVAFGYAAAQKEPIGRAIPGCFIADTVYHAVLDFHVNRIEVAYGLLPLVSVSFTPHDDVASFAEKWNDKTKSSWQTATTRHVWAGHPQVSDTVIRIVSEIAAVDPIRIQRLLPDRFDLELTGGFRLRIMTPAGDSAHKEFGEKWHEFKSRWNPFSRVTVLEILVSPQDAQTLYYGLEPGTPVIVQSGAGAKGK